MSLFIIPIALYWIVFEKIRYPILNGI
ncbi:hypothetical protein OA2633_02391 [Oceanicaulis sp. HTCC2633]|nr:hypothetical protein OA2633_02391 [Oceanicaulis sp. HTCC2633]